MTADCLFCRIVAGVIPADRVLETDRVLAFRDIAPKAPVHVLVIPKTHYSNVSDLANDPELGGAVLAAGAQVAAAEGIAESGFRLIFNTGSDGGQEVFHVHAHVLGGAPLGPMLSH